MMGRVPRAALLLAALLGLHACGKGPAETALKAAEQTFAAVKDDAMQFVPHDAKEVQGALATAQSRFKRGDYRAALAAAQEVSAKVPALASAAAAKKAELTKAWADMSSLLPPMIGTIKSRVEAWARPDKRPENLDEGTIGMAQAGLVAASQIWEGAMSDAQAGHLAEALSKASLAKTRATEIMRALGIAVPAAAR